MNLKILAVVLIAATAPLGAQKKPTAPVSPLAGAAGFRCAFPAFGTARWTGLTAAPLSGTQDFTFNIDSLDYKKGRARIVAAGAAWATMVLTGTGINIIEQTPAGNFNMTTIFSTGNEGQKFPAVHSRHLNSDTDAGMPRASQAFGSCERLP